MGADADILQLISQVKVEGNFDQADEVVLNWLSRRHMTMCARSRCYRLGGSVVLPDDPEAAAALFPLVLERLNDIDPSTESTGFVELVDFGGEVPWGKVDFGTYKKVVAGQASMRGTGGIYAVAEWDDPEQPFNSTVEAVFPWPVPGPGEMIYFRVAALPFPLNLNDHSSAPQSATQLKVPPQYYDAIVAGAIATGLARTEQRPDLASSMKQEFDDGCEELRRHMNRKYRGGGPATIRVVGYDA